MMASLLRPVIHAHAYDEGYLYPGPTVRGVPGSLAPRHSQEVIAEFGRPEHAALIAGNPIEPPLRLDRMTPVFQRWDQTVGTRRRGLMQPTDRQPALIRPRDLVTSPGVGPIGSRGRDEAGRVLPSVPGWP